jgi:DNA-directed RNA polymerase subunit RPC12/RpoP
MTEERKRVCSECGRPAAHLFEIDRALVCATCLYGRDRDPITTTISSMHASTDFAGSREHLWLLL